MHRIKNVVMLKELADNTILTDEIFSTTITAGELKSRMANKKTFEEEHWFILEHIGWKPNASEMMALYIKTIGTVNGGKWQINAHEAMTAERLLQLQKMMEEWFSGDAAAIPKRGPYVYC